MKTKKTKKTQFDIWLQKLLYRSPPSMRKKRGRKPLQGQKDLFGEATSYQTPH